jgi:hypothetical protein
LGEAQAFIGELELLQMFEVFLDRAIYYAAVGYELETAGAGCPPGGAAGYRVAGN